MPTASLMRTDRSPASILAIVVECIGWMPLADNIFAMSACDHRRFSRSALTRCPKRLSVHFWLPISATLRFWVDKHNHRWETQVAP